MAEESRFVNSLLTNKVESHFLGPPNRNWFEKLGVKLQRSKGREMNIGTRETKGNNEQGK